MEIQLSTIKDKGPPCGLSQEERAILKYTAFLCVFAAAMRFAPATASPAPFSPADPPPLAITSDERAGGAYQTAALFLNTEEEGLCAVFLEDRFLEDRVLEDRNKPLSSLTPPVFTDDEPLFLSGLHRAGDFAAKRERTALLEEAAFAAHEFFWEESGGQWIPVCSPETTEKTRAMTSFDKTAGIGGVVLGVTLVYAGFCIIATPLTDGFGGSKNKHFSNKSTKRVKKKYPAIARTVKNLCLPVSAVQIPVMRRLRDIF